MSSFVNRGVKVFAKDEGFLLTRKRSEGRMKRYESAQDLRAWCLSTEEKRRYLIELMLRSSGGEDAYGKYIPVPILISTITAMKDAQIEELEKMLAAYRSLNLTDEQRAQLNKQLGQSGDNKLKKQDSTTVLFRRKDKVCRCAPPMEKEELMGRIRELQDELERRDKEAKRQMSCLEKCIAKEKRRVEKVKQSLADERRIAEGKRSGELGKSTSSCAERADSALRQVDADQSTICALECKLSELRAANLELQSLLDTEKRKSPSCDPKQCEAIKEMHNKMEAAQKSEAAMREKLASLESYLRRSNNFVGRPSGCTGPTCVQQRRSCKDRSSTPPGDFHPSPPRRQSISPNRSRIPSEDRSHTSLTSDEWSSSTDQSRSTHRCRPPFVSTPSRNSTDEFRSKDVNDHMSKETGEKGPKCRPCAENRQYRPAPPPGDLPCRQEVVQPQIPKEKMVPAVKPFGLNCQPCSEKRVKEEKLLGDPRFRQEVVQPLILKERMNPALKPFGTTCQACAEKRLRETNLSEQPPSRQERSKTPGPQIGLLMDSSGSMNRCPPCARRSSSGGPEFNNRREQANAREQSENERAGAGHRDCWKLMVSRPKNASSAPSVTSEGSEDSTDVSYNASESGARDFVCTSRSPSPSVCHQPSCPASLANYHPLRETSPISGHKPPVQAMDSFRIVSETYRSPVSRQGSPSTGEQQEYESECPGPNPTYRGVRDPSPPIGERRGCMNARITAQNDTVSCRGSSYGTPFPPVREQKGLMDARIPVPNSTNMGSYTIRSPSLGTEEQMLIIDKNIHQSPVIRDPSPMSGDRRKVINQKRLQSPIRGPLPRDQSPAFRESRAVGPNTATRDHPSAFGNRRVVLDASKIPSRKGRMQKTRRNPTPNVSSRRKSPVSSGERRTSVDINRGLHMRRQSPITVDGRPISDPRRNQTMNDSCRDRSPKPIVLLCSSRDPSPAERCGRQTTMAERSGCVREASPRSQCSPPRGMQCEPIEQPALRKSVPFSTMPNNGRCGNQAKQR